MAESRVTIAGGGPVGPIGDQRAAALHPPSLEMLEALEVHEVFTEGLKSTPVNYWDRVTGARVAALDCGVLRPDTAHPFVIQFEHYKIVHTVMRHLARR